MVTTAVAAALLAGCSSGPKASVGSPDTAAQVTTTQQTPPPVHKTTTTLPTIPVGSARPLNVADGVGGVAQVFVSRVQTATVEPGELGSTPSRGLYVVFYVKAVGAQGSMDVSPYDFYQVSADGAHVSDTAYAPAWGTELDTATLQPGENITGVLVYDVSPKGAHGKLVYSPLMATRPIGQWIY